MLRKPDSIPSTDTVIEDAAMEPFLLVSLLPEDLQFMKGLLKEKIILLTLKQFVTLLIFQMHLE